MSELDAEEIEALITEWASRKPLVGRVHIFGSRARGDHRPDSDIDVAIELDMSAASGCDESGGLATWAFDTKEWPGELAAVLPWKVDLQQYRGASDTPVIHQAIQRSSRLVYVKPDIGSGPRGVAVAEEVAPTGENLRRYPETGGYLTGFVDPVPCTCQPSCAPRCAGECGCEACLLQFADFCDDAGVHGIEPGSPAEQAALIAYREASEDEGALTIIHRGRFDGR